jgi:hypothetical protein
VISAADIGMPREEWVVTSFTGYLKPQGADVGTSGKTFARDVISYEYSDDSIQLSEAESIAISCFGADEPRVWLLNENLGSIIIKFLSLIPAELRRNSGKVALTYFRYNDQVEVGMHQDQFGDVVAIWTLYRTAGGGASFLRTGTQEEVLREELPSGSLLIFRDEPFWHGFTALAPGGTREALVLIRLKDGY